MHCIDYSHIFRYNEYTKNILIKKTEEDMKKNIITRIFTVGLLLFLSFALLPSMEVKADSHAPIESDGVYLISTEEDLNWVAEQVNTGVDSFLGKTLKLTNTIEFVRAQNKSWTPIGTGTNPFAGYFDGDGYEISGLEIKSSVENSVENAGLFGVVADSGTIVNLGINCKINATNNVGSLAGLNYGKILNCYNSATTDTDGLTELPENSSVEGSSNVGGLVGQNNGTVINCYSASIVKGSSNVGGLVGQNDGTVTNCYWLILPENPDLPALGSGSGTNILSFTATESTGPILTESTTVGGIIANQLTDVLTYGSYETATTPSQLRVWYTPDSMAGTTPLFRNDTFAIPSAAIVYDKSIEKGESIPLAKLTDSGYGTIYATVIVHNEVQLNEYSPAGTYNDVLLKVFTDTHIGVKIIDFTIESPPRPTSTPFTVSDIAIDQLSSTATINVHITPKVQGKSINARLLKWDLEDIVDDLLLDATKEAVDPILNINVDLEDRTTALDLTLSAKALEKFSETDGASLTVSSPLGSMSFDKAAINAILGERTSSGSVKAYNITIGMQKADVRDLTPEQQESIGDSHVFTFFVNRDAEEVKNFGDGEVTITLPYTLTGDEVGNKVAVFYVDSKGNLYRVNATYDHETQMITFTTTHFSEYVIKWEDHSPTERFIDLEAGKWYTQYTDFVYDNGIMQGISDEHFAPNDSANRAMLWTVMSRIDGHDIASDSNTWYFNAMQWVITQGISDGTNPEGFISREQFATMLYRLAEEPIVTGELSFTDSEDVSDYAAVAMLWATENGILQGYEDNTLNPQGLATRAELSAMIMRYMSLSLS